MDRLAVLARHLAAAPGAATTPTPSSSTAVAAAPTAAAVTPSPTAAAAPSDLGAFCPKALHRFITPDNYELREAVKAFLKVCVGERKGERGGRPAGGERVPPPHTHSDGRGIPLGRGGFPPAPDTRPVRLWGAGGLVSALEGWPPPPGAPLSP